MERDRFLSLIFANLRSKMLWGLLLAVAVMVGLAIYGDAPKIGAALAGFPWQWTPVILGLTLSNYLLRFAKWEYYLRQIGVRGFPRRQSFLIFFAGLSMVITPGKVGEWLKCYLLKELTGTPFSRSAPIVIAERLTDGLAMALLATGGLVAFGIGWPVVVAMVLAAALIVALSQIPPLALGLLRVAQRLPLVSSFAYHLQEFYLSSRTLLSPKNLLLAVGLGFAAWLLECLALYLVLNGLGVTGGWLLLIQGAFIFSVSQLAGALLLVPGGLGVVEGGMTGLVQVLLGLPKDLAATATLIIRLLTLWFGVSVGLVALYVINRRLGPHPAPSPLDAV